MSSDNGGDNMSNGIKATDIMSLFGAKDIDNEGESLAEKMENATYFLHLAQRSADGQQIAEKRRRNELSRDEHREALKKIIKEIMSNREG
jgi:lysyl-tRNA synthetase class I